MNAKDRTREKTDSFSSRPKPKGKGIEITEQFPPELPAQARPALKKEGIGASLNGKWMSNLKRLAQESLLFLSAAFPEAAVSAVQAVSSRTVSARLGFRCLPLPMLGCLCGAGSRFCSLCLRFRFLSLHRDRSIDKADKIPLARRQLREENRDNRQQTENRYSQYPL